MITYLGEPVRVYGRRLQEQLNGRLVSKKPVVRDQVWDQVWAQVWAQLRKDLEC